MDKYRTKAFWVNLFSFSNKTRLQKLIYIVIALVLIPYLWWAYLIILAYVVIKKPGKIKDFFTRNKGKNLKTTLISIAVFIVFVTTMVWVNNAYGALTISDLPELTNQKEQLLAGTSSYKNGQVVIKLNDAEQKVKIDSAGEYSYKLELKEGENTLKVMPVSEKGKQGWQQTKELTLDTVLPNKPELKNPKDKTTDADVEVEMSTNEDGKVEAKKGENVVASAETSNKNAKIKLNLEMGENSFEIFAIDKAGNKSAEATVYKITREKKPDEPKAQEQKKLYAVVKVVDGDTVDVDIDGKTERIRLIGLDTPETVDPRTTVQCFGQEASTQAHTLLDGKKVTLEADATQGERDTYGRLLRYIFIEDGTDFSKTMIENGYGHEYTYQVPYKRQNEYKEAQKQAESGKKGLWAANTCAGTTTAVTPVPAAAATTPSKSTTTPAPKTTAPAQTGTNCVIKGNISSGGKIYHVPGGAYYEKTDIDTTAGERWFCSEAEAVAAGWRKSLK